MKMTFKEMEEIVNSLPIGYYAKRRIPVKLDHAETSFFNIVDKTITVSYEGVSVALEKVDEANKEVAVRSSLYHEVSHALLTTTELFNPEKGYCDWYTNKPVAITPEFNIVEDERIETVCGNKYLNVDFVKNRYWINGLEPNAPLPKTTDPMNAFYNLVRFHEGEQSWLDRAKELIDDFKDLNILSRLSNWYWYHREVEKFYHDFVKKFNADPESYNNSPNYKSSPYTSDLQGEQMVGSAEADPNADHEEANPEQSEKKENEPGGRSGGFDEMFSNLYNEVTEHYTLDQKTSNQLEAILSNFNKKNGGGASITAYSGRLNPRQMIRDEYKIFERKSSIRGSNTYGSLHLNLFIDVSGSFYYNKDSVNRLLICLQNLEKRYSYFTFDLVKCGEGEILADKNHRLIDPSGGNRLTHEVVSFFRQLQKPQTQNCNIMLFDGDCYPENGVFEKLDNSNLTVIAERGNQRYLRVMEKAKVIYENNDYANMLTDNVLKIMARSFK